MNYQHVYHAGNFADVIKHLVLISILTELNRKENPYCYIDTHAGAGFYDLHSLFAAKNKEFKNGIEKVMQANSPPPLIKAYLNSVHAINKQLANREHDPLRFYPGSPLIARFFARESDRLIFCEWQNQAYQLLKQNLASQARSFTYHMDGFLGLKAFLPPKERRGLILIDPPYEDPNEFSHVAQSLATALKRFETGIYAIWYPIKTKLQEKNLLVTLKQIVSRPILIIEFTIYPELPLHLNGCGLVIINPPWMLEERLNSILDWAWQVLSINQQGRYRSYHLK